MLGEIFTNASFGLYRFRIQAQYMVYLPALCRSWTFGTGTS